MMQVERMNTKPFNIYSGFALISIIYSIGEKNPIAALLHPKMHLFGDLTWRMRAEQKPIFPRFVSSFPRAWRAYTQAIKSIKRMNEQKHRDIY